MSPSGQIVEVPIKGMCCADEAEAVQRAIGGIPGVLSVEVLLAAEKARIVLEPDSVDMTSIDSAVESTGCTVGNADTNSPQHAGRELVRRGFTLFGVVVGALLFAVVAGEMLGLFEVVTDAVPWPVWAALILLGGYPVVRNVVRAALQRRVTSHTLMTLGLVAAVAVGEWPAAVLLVFFMRVGDYVESFTTDRVRSSLRALTSASPQQARVESGDSDTLVPIEVMVPVEQVKVGQVVVIRPGEQIPADGEVVGGHATVNQSSITGESMPVEVSAGSTVFAASLCQLGALRVRTSRVGADTAFGRMVRLVEEAETNRAEVQRFADRFSSFYLPIVAAISLATFLLTGNLLASAAVLVVACSCAFALATPIAMLATIGSAAGRGVLIKGGKYIELLTSADVVLLDKTGTLTIGRPRIVDIVPLNGVSAASALTMAASVERYSEHPVAEAIREKARELSLTLEEPTEFAAVPGIGVRATLRGTRLAVGSHRLLAEARVPAAVALEEAGKTLLYLLSEGEPIAVFAAMDTLRPEIPESLARLRKCGVERIELLTGDNERTAAALAAELGIDYRANLLPEDKIAAVRAYQAQGHKVVMVGDGVNDAAALAQADVGIAMGVAGSDIAIEASHITLMRDDWRLVPEVFEVARQTMSVVRLNIAFTAVYNVVGLTLAAMGFLPLAIAASAQALPDLGMLGNSSRLLRRRQVGRA